MKVVIILRSAPFCKRIITFFKLPSVHCNKYLDIALSKHEQWIYIPSWKLKFAPNQETVEVSQDIWWGIV